MIIGIDLATVNCGLCFYRDENTLDALNTVGMKDLQPETVQNFAKSLGLLVKNQIVYVDFNYNECFLRGKKKHLAVKYYLAGYIQATAKEAHFITPTELRKYYGFGAKEKKYTLHEKLLTPLFRKTYNEHECDAYLLARMGYELQKENN